MNLKTNLLFISLLLLSVVAQCAFGNFPFAFFAFPLDLLLALIWIGGMGYTYKEKRSSVAVRIWLSPQCTYWTLGWFLGGCLVIGLFPQLSVQDAVRKSGVLSTLGCYHFTSSWIFVTGLFGLLTHLGMITLRRFFLPGRSQWRFMLNHAGLWLALFAGFMSACFSIGLGVGEKLCFVESANVFKTLPATLIVTLGGFITNAAYCFYQNFRNKSWDDYGKKSFYVNNVLFCALAGVLWYSQFFSLSLGKGFLTASPVLLTFSWCILMSLNVAFSNIWGIILKEWNGCTLKTITVLFIGLMVLIISSFLPQLLTI